MGQFLSNMYLLPLEIWGLITVNCYEGGIPCGSTTDAKNEALVIIKELECADRWEVTDECKALVKSSEQKFSDSINAFVKTGEDVNFRWDRWNKTLLHKAASLGYKEAVIALLENGARTEERSRFEYTALIYAAREGRVDTVRTLLEHGASVNAANDQGGTALIFAAENGHNEVAEILLESGSELNSQGGRGYTPLTHAAENGNSVLVTDLLKRGALTELRTIYNDNEVTALIKAASNGHNDIVMELIAHGADIDAADNMGSTALGHAAKHGHTNVVSKLLENGASAENKEGNDTPLMLAAQKGHKEIVSLLLKHGADPKVETKRYRDTALEYARGNDHDEIAEMIQEYL